MILKFENCLRQFESRRFYHPKLMIPNGKSKTSQKLFKGVKKDSPPRKKIKKKSSFGDEKTLEVPRDKHIRIHTTLATT